MAERNAEFLLHELSQGNGRLLRTWKNGEAKLNGYLEDYSYLSEGLLVLYQTTFDPHWFLAAQELTETMNAMAATVPLKLAGLTNEVRYVDIAHEALTQTEPMMAQYPLGFGQWLQALSYTLAKPKEIAIIGDPDASDTRALLDVVRHGYRPFQVVALGAPAAHLAVPLLQDRGLVEGHAADYVCRESTCQAPVTETEGLRAQLE